MAKKPQAGLKALRKRYITQLADIRREYEGRAVRELQKLQRSNESDYKILARQFRKELAILKRKKVIPSNIDVRKAKPSASLGKKLNDLYDVVKGTRRPVKVSRKVERELREQGFLVREGRVILAPSYKVKKGMVVQPGSGIEPVKIITLGKRFDKQIDAAFAGLGRDEYITIDLGDNYGQMFSKMERQEFAQWALRYLSGSEVNKNSSNAGKGMKYLTIVKVTDDEVDEREYARARHHVELRKRDRARAADKRRQKAEQRGYLVKPRGPMAHKAGIPKAGIRVPGASSSKSRKR